MMDKSIAGQSITLGPDRCCIARRLLEGKAFSDFEASVTANSYTEMHGNLERILGDVAIPIFPPRALQKQRRMLRRYMPKPLNMPVT